MPSAFDVRAWLRENRNGLETHDRGGRIEDRKGECVREDRNDTYVCCSVYVAQESMMPDRATAGGH